MGFDMHAAGIEMGHLIARVLHSSYPDQSHLWSNQIPKGLLAGQLAEVNHLIQNHGFRT